MRSAGRKPKHERKVGPEERQGRGSGSARPPEQESAAWAELNIVEEGDEPEEAKPRRQKPPGKSEDASADIGSTA